MAGKDHNISKRPKTVQFWDRDIVCLPQSTDLELQTSIAYPRGKCRAELAESGLVGKIRLNSAMTVEEVGQEIRSVFKGPMRGSSNFKFMFLQPTGSGSCTLTVPSTSSSFSWTAHQVAKLGGYKQSIYIIAVDQVYLR